MLVYRMEHPDYADSGPYNGGLLPGDTCYLLNGMYNAHMDRGELSYRPAPPADGIGPAFWDVAGDPLWVCGCDTRQKLEWWFEGYMDKLFDLGFALTTYEVAGDQVMTGIQQVVFNKDYATLIESEVRIKELEAA